MRDFLQSALKGKSADFIEIRVQKTLQNRIEFQGQDLDRIDSSNDYGGNVRAIVDGGVGFVSFNKLDDIHEKVNLAIEQAKLIGDRIPENTSFSDVEPVVDHVTVEPQEDPRKLSLTQKKELLEEYNDIILSYGKPVTSSRIRYFDNFTKLYYINTDGSYIEQEKLDLGGGIIAIAADQGHSQMSVVGFGSSDDFGVVRNLHDRINKACQKATQMTKADPIKGGSYPVILDPSLAGVFVHEAFGHLSESDQLYENKRLREIMKLGTKFGGRHLNIYDTGDTPGARGYLKYDDEGVRTQKTDLIKEGELVGRLHTRESAAKMGEKPTGNARAINYNHPPICRMRTTCIAPGDATWEDMIKDVKLGVYAVDAYGGQTNGEMFTFKAGEAYMIRDGKLAEMVRDVNLTGNVFETLNNIDLISSDYQVKDTGGGCGKGEQGPLPTSQGSPSIRIQNVIIGGKSDG
ncbi:TldD/PmbA family protein [Natranaerobius thermophilus]|uniref:Peptidase U62 modulator of DNA gyrase n=1 Tax=Natranaerobius thermophilus (strain ATCC BAA-1301 / DSM 18059 / JW/NM-WN-LF) TaxID=457570 RepID=B2A5P5_NATTJ|nr:TldD/PmbA family protein [Natranaerobius thermophilus]ACB83993.1 peptidase U62 modulator of DNA gyrase [Natranaerobius thermophilus JW/NM-WN-LF]